MPDGETVAGPIGSAGRPGGGGKELRIPPIGAVILDVVRPPPAICRVGGDDHVLRLYSIDGELRRTFVGQRGRIVRVLFSPDGKRCQRLDDHTVASGRRPSP